jgi:histidinol dehydrogenase
MPRYTFKLKDDCDGVEDESGVNLPNADIAYRYASDVVRELMHGREPSTRFWQLDVYDDVQTKIFEISFAELDQTLDHLNPHMRAAVEHAARRIRSVKDTYRAAETTVREARSLMARSRGKPYLVVDRGRKVIRDDC